jgi:hypothetical protein
MVWSLFRRQIQHYFQFNLTTLPTGTSRCPYVTSRFRGLFKRSRCSYCLWSCASLLQCLKQFRGEYNGTQSAEPRHLGGWDFKVRSGVHAIWDPVTGAWRYSTCNSGINTIMLDRNHIARRGDRLVIPITTTPTGDSHIHIFTFPRLLT